MSQKEPINATIRVKRSNLVPKYDLRKAFQEATHISIDVSPDKLRKMPKYDGDISQKRKLTMPGVKLVFFKESEVLLVIILKSSATSFISIEDYDQFAKIRLLAGKQVSVNISGERVQISEVITL